MDTHLNIKFLELVICKINCVLDSKFTIYGTGVHHDPQRQVLHNENSYVRDEEKQHENSKQRQCCNNQSQTRAEFHCHQ